MLVVPNTYRHVVSVPVTELWFPQSGDHFELPPDRRAIIVRGYHLREKVGGFRARWRRRKTLLSDLIHFDSLAPSLHSALRRDINRGLSRDRLTIVENWTPEQFHEFFVRFDPDNPGPADLNRIRALRRLGRLTLRVMVRDTEPLCAHAYLEDAPRVLLLHTYSRRKSVDRRSGDYRLISRANKALHYADLAFYAKRGFQSYDWGGYMDDENYGPDTFKKRFRGAVAESWSFDALVLRPVSKRLEFFDRLRQAA